VLEVLTSDTSTYDLYEEYGIMVWQPFEDEGHEWLAKQIASLYDSYINCAEHALKEGK
jgi:beta-galactosidase/beta-glucuronidase